jgi:hypothetical protein
MEATTLEARRMLLQRRRMLARICGPGMGGAPAAGTHLRAAEGTLERERAELAEIDAALERIAEGTFGSCVRCGGAIGHQRLRAVPETPYCMACRG